MKDLKTTFDSGELNILYRVFTMFKYGIEDEYDQLKVISSPIFKELFDNIYSDLRDLSNSRVPNNRRQPIHEYIDQKDVPFKTLKNNVDKCIKMHKGNPDISWSEWQEGWKRNMIINLASPYLIKDSTIDEILNNR